MPLPVNLTLGSRRRAGVAPTPDDIRDAIKGGWWTAGALNFSDAGVTPVADGGTVRQINSRFPTAYPMSQATGGERPVASLSGVPALVFNGTKAMIAPKPGGGSHFQPWAIYCVARYTGTTGGNMTLFDGSNQNEGRVYSSNPAIGISGFSAGPVGAINGNFTNVTKTFKLSSKDVDDGVVFWMNGNAPVEASTTAALSGVAIGGNTPDNQRLVGLVHDLIFLKGEATPDEDALILQYLRDTWGHY